MGNKRAAGPGFANAGQAVQAIMSGMQFLAGSDHVALTAAERAGCLQGLETAEAVLTAARAGVGGGAGRPGGFGGEGHPAGTRGVGYAPQITPARTGRRK